MKNRFCQYILGVIFVILFFPVPADAESARSLIEKGNQAFEQGDYTASLQQYNKAAEMEPDSAIVLFNMGDVLYRQEKYAEALNVFEQAAVKALQNNDRLLEAQSRYNMGNSSFHEAGKLRQKDLEMSLAEYKRSSQYYQSAAKLDPEFTDAAYNLEASRIAVKQIEELIRKQRQEAQQNEQQKQNIAKELENLQKEQQDAAEQSRQQEGSKNKETDQSEQLAENQKSITDQTREAGKKLEKLIQDKDAELSDEMAREHVNRAVEKQEEAEKKLQQNKLSEAHENQQQASHELQKALEQLAQNQIQNQDQEQNKDKSDQQEEEEAEKQKAEQQEQNEQQTSADEAEQLEEQGPPVSENYGDVSPEDIINEEIENKKYRSVRGKTGYAPVEKDW